MSELLLGIIGMKVYPEYECWWGVYMALAAAVLIVRLIGVVTK